MLILHEGDERRHHYCEALQHHRGELIDQRFAAAGGHDDERIPAFEQRLDRRPLAGAEVFMAEAGAQLGQSFSFGDRILHNRAGAIAECGSRTDSEVRIAD